MKGKNQQAILITAYKDYTYLEHLIENIYRYFDVYIHIDKKSYEISKNNIQQLKAKYHCCVISKYDIKWGSINHVYAIIELLKMASKFEYVYYHIITGEDIPTRPCQEILYRFRNDEKIYIAMNETKDTIWEERYKYYYLLKNKDLRKKINGRINQMIITAQKKAGISRKKIGKESNIYKGYVYGSLPHKAVKYILSYISVYPEFLKDLSYCYIPEEFFFQTILENSELREKIVPNCLRYSVWKSKHGSNPGYLDEEDIDKIDCDDYIFARKVNFKYSTNLIAILDKRWLKN